jgi:hypothetical protein
MDTRDFGFGNEFAFVDAAARDPRAYASLRTYIEAVAASEVDRLAPTPTASRNALIGAAMVPFDRALLNYRRGRAGVPHPFPFSAYYRWWARQYAIAHDAAVRSGRL